MALVKPITLPPPPPSHPSITEKPQSGNVFSESLTEEVRHGTGILKNEHEVGKTEIMVPPPLAVVLQPQRTLARGDGKKKGSHEEAEILFDELAVNGETSSHEPPISKSHVSLFRTYNSAMYKGDDLDPLVKAADVAAPISTHWVSRQRQLQLVESMRAQSSDSVLRNHVSRSPTPVNTGKRISHAPSLGRLGSQAQNKPEKVETKPKSVAESLLCAVPIDHVFKSPTPALLPNEMKQLVAQSIKTALGSALRESNSSSDMLTHLSDIEVAETRFIERFVAKMAKAFPTACEPNASGCNNEPIKYTHAGTAKTTAMNGMDKGTMRNTEEQLLISYLLKNHVSKLFPAQKRQLQNAEIRSVSMRERDHITQEALFHIVAREVGVFPYQPMTSTGLPRISTTSTEFAVNGKYSEHHKETEAYGLEEAVELRTAFSRMLAFCLRYGLHNTAIHTLDCTALVGVDGELVGGVKATNCRGSLNNASPAVESGRAKTLWVIGVRTPPTRCRRLLWLYPYRNGTYSLEEYISSKQWLNRTVDDASRALSGTSDPHAGEDSGKTQQLAIGLVGQVLSGKGPSCPSGDARPSPSKNSPLYDLLRAHLQNRYVNMPLIVMPGPTLSSITSLSPSDGPPSCAYSAGMTWGGSLPISAQVLHDMLFEGKHTVFPYENSLVEVTTTSTRRVCQYIAQHELIVSLHCDYTRLEDPRNVEGGFPSTARPQVFLVARFDDGLTMTCLRREPWVPCVRPSLPSSPLSTEFAQISTSLTLSEASRATPMKTSAVRPYSRKQQLLAAALHHSGGEGPARPTSKPAAGPSGKAHAGRPAETGLVESAATPDLPPVPVVLSSPLNEEGAVRLQGVGRGSGLSQGPASLQVSDGGVPSRPYVSDNGGPSLFFSSQVGTGCDTAGGRSREGGKGFPHAVPSALGAPKHTLAVCLASSNFTFADDGRDANADDGFARDAGALRLTYHGNPDEGGVAPVESLCCVHVNRGAASEWHFTTEREGAREVDRYTGVVTRTFLSGNQQILFPDGGIVNRYREVSQAPAFNNEHFDSISFDQSHSRFGSHSYSESQMSSPHPASLKGEDGAEKTEPQEKRYTTYCETLITASGRCYVRTVHDLTPFQAEPIPHQTKRHDADPSQDPSLAQQFVLLPRRLGSKRSYDSGHECVVVSREDGVCSAWYVHTDQPSRTTPTPATVGDVMEKRVGGFDRDSPENLSARAYARVVLHTDGTSITTLNVSRRVPVASMSKWLEQNMVLAPLGREITHVENLCADLPRSAPDDTMQIPAMRVRFCIESTRMPRIFLVLPDSVAVGISSVRPRAAYYAIFHDGSILLRRRCRPLGGGEREKDKESGEREEGGYHGETLLTRAGMTSLRVLHDEAIVRVEPAAAVAAVEGRPHAIAVGEGFPTFDLAHGGLHIVDSCQQITEVTRLFSRETEPRVGVRPSTWKELLRALVTERFSPHRVPRRKQQEMNQRQLDREAAGEGEGNSSKDVERQRAVPFYASFGIRRQRLAQEYVIQQELLRSDVLAQHLERERRARTGEGRPPGVLPLFFSQRGGGGKEGKGEEVVAFLPDGALAAGMRAARATSGAAILATAGEWRSPWGLGNPHPSFLIAARSALGGEPDLQQISLTLVKSSSDGEGGDSFLPDRGGPEVEPSPEDGFLLFTDALKRQVRLSKFLCGFSVEAVLGGYPSADNGAKLTMKRENTSTASSPTNNHTLHEKEALLTSLWGRQLWGGVGRWLPPSIQPCRLPTCGPNSAPTNADGENIIPRQHAQKLLRSFICFKKLPNPEKVIMDEVRRQDTLNKMKAITKPVT
ncbi:unnamed protein product [Phytomonas sp. EM1]|nr:unnamed protein product [Phytomonas sp. EM1]|eukprot:CCW64750.1 unnamed protein product [Phytomonas sp. isolate EM1]